MSTDNKTKTAPREFNIIFNEECDCPSVEVESETARIFANEKIHVIERSAYQALEARAHKLLEALEENKSWLNGQILKRHEFVRQLDGSLKSEFIPTYAAELLGRTESAIAEFKEASNEYRK